MFNLPHSYPLSYSPYDLVEDVSLAIEGGVSLSGVSEAGDVVSLAVEADVSIAVGSDVSESFAIGAEAGLSVVELAEANGAFDAAAEADLTLAFSRIAVSDDDRISDVTGSRGSAVLRLSDRQSDVGTGD